MSGGAFDYYQYHIDDIIERIKEEIERATCERPPKVKRTFVSVWEEHYSSRIYRNEYHFKSLDEAREYFKSWRGAVDFKEGENQFTFRTELGDFKVREVEIEEYERDENGNEQYFPDYTEETIAEFRKGVELLKRARVYAHRIDWLISGDDGEETFHERLREKLEELEGEH